MFFSHSWSILISRSSKKCLNLWQNQHSCWLWDSQSQQRVWPYHSPSGYASSQMSSCDHPWWVWVHHIGAWDHLFWRSHGWLWHWLRMWCGWVESWPEHPLGFQQHHSRCPLPIRGRTMVFNKFPLTIDNFKMSLIVQNYVGVFISSTGLQLQDQNWLNCDLGMFLL